MSKTKIKAKKKKETKQEAKKTDKHLEQEVDIGSRTTQQELEFCAGYITFLTSPSLSPEDGVEFKAEAVVNIAENRQTEEYRITISPVVVDSAWLAAANSTARIVFEGALDYIGDELTFTLPSKRWEALEHISARIVVEMRKLRNEIGV